MLPCKTFFSIDAPEERTADRLVDLLLESWQHNRAGFSDLADEERWRQRALAQMRTFAQTHDLAARPLLLEGYFEVPINERLALLGRIDRADEDDGGLHIIDYKTGRRPQDVDADQLHLYTIILERSLGRPVARASYLYLDDGSAWTVTPQRSHRRRKPRHDDRHLRGDAGGASICHRRRQALLLLRLPGHLPAREEIVGRRLAGGLVERDRCLSTSSAATAAAVA